MHVHVVDPVNAAAPACAGGACKIASQRNRATRCGTDDAGRAVYDLIFFSFTSQ